MFVSEHPPAAFANCPVSQTPSLLAYFWKKKRGEKRGWRGARGGGAVPRRGDTRVSTSSARCQAPCPARAPASGLCCGEPGPLQCCGLSWSLSSGPGEAQGVLHPPPGWHVGDRHPARAAFPQAGGRRYCFCVGSNRTLELASLWDDTCVMFIVLTQTLKSCFTFVCPYISPCNWKRPGMFC